MPSDLPKLFTSAMPRVHTIDDQLPWVFGLKPRGVLLAETGDFLITEDGLKISVEDGDTKSQVVRTGPTPGTRTADMPEITSTGLPRTRTANG